MQQNNKMFVDFKQILISIILNWMMITNKDQKIFITLIGINLFLVKFKVAYPNKCDQTIKGRTYTIIFNSHVQYL